MVSCQVPSIPWLYSYVQITPQHCSYTASHIFCHLKLCSVVMENLVIISYQQSLYTAALHLKSKLLEDMNWALKVFLHAPWQPGLPVPIKLTHYQLSHPSIEHCVLQPDALDLGLGADDIKNQGPRKATLVVAVAARWSSRGW